MEQGTVMWFSEEKGCNFITPGDAGEDIFVHYTTISHGRFRSLEE